MLKFVELMEPGKQILLKCNHTRKKTKATNTYILTVIDIFSKFAWTVPVKSKKGEDVTAAMKSVLDNGRVTKNLHVDRGKEFYN